MPKRKLAETSLEAWASIHPEQLNNHHAKIITALAELKTASSEQISTHTNLHYWQVTRRMSELERKQLIYNTRIKVATRTGRSAFAYALCSPNAIPERATEKVMPGKTIAEYSKELIQPSLF